MNDTTKLDQAAKDIADIAMRAAVEYMHQRSIPYTAGRGEAICGRMRALFLERLDGMMVEAREALETDMPEAALATLVASAKLVGIQAAVEVTA